MNSKIAMPTPPWKAFGYALPRLNRHEISGSLGDLGTFLPLLVGMSITNGLNFASALFFAGLFNIVTGLTFSIPMAVQPMKAIAAVAISERLSLEQILAAGIWTSAIVFILGITGLITFVDRFIPKPVVRGLQLGLGLQLIQQGLHLVRNTHVLWGFDSISIGFLGFALVLAFASSRKIPSALILFIAGLGLAVASNMEVITTLRIGFNLPHWVPLNWGDFRSSFFRAALPQIPLTTLNSAASILALGSTATGFVLGWILALLIGWNRKDRSTDGNAYSD